MLRNVFFYLFLSTGWLQAQPTGLTLLECLDLAYAHNLDLRKSGNDAQLADVALKESKFARLPNLQLSSSMSLFNGRVIDPTTNDFVTEQFLSNDVSVNSGVLLYGGGRLNEQVKMSQIDQRLAKERYEATRDNIGLAVINTFLNVVMAQENFKNAESLYKVSQEQLNRVNQLVSVGVRPRIELQNAEVQVAQDRQSVVGFENELSIQKLQLQQLIRWEGTDDVEVVMPAFEGEWMKDEAYGFEMVYEAAVQAMPAIKAAELSEERARSQIRLARASFFPTLTASATLNTRYSNSAHTYSYVEGWVPLSFRLNGQPIDAEIRQSLPMEGDVIPLGRQWDQNLGYGVGLNLSVPIFNRWTTRANVQRARIQEVNASIDTEAAKDQLKRDIQSALAALRAARSNYDAAAKTMEVASAALESNQKSFEVGGVNLYDLTQARTQYDNAQRSLVTSKYNYIFRLKVLDYFLGRELNL